MSKKRQELEKHSVFESKYCGHPVLRISRVDEDGKEEAYGVIIAFGITKARFILKNIDNIKKFVEGHGFYNEKEIPCGDEIDGEKINYNETLDSVFIPKNSMIALGYLFWATVKLDGHIDKSEVNKLKEHLNRWKDSSAKLILSAINYAEPSISSNDISQIFDHDGYFSEKVKESIQNCIEFLKENSYVEVRRVMFEQVMGIIKADGKFHENERWVRDQMKNSWSDI